jgi:hypothetical protein
MPGYGKPEKFFSDRNAVKVKGNGNKNDDNHRTEKPFPIGTTC